MSTNWSQSAEGGRKVKLDTKSSHSEAHDHRREGRKQKEKNNGTEERKKEEKKKEEKIGVACGGPGWELLGG
jgi:hypothetical protein